MFKHRISFIYFCFLVLLLFFGCSSSPLIVERVVEVPVYYPAVRDTITLQDTVILKDSLWFGEVTDSLGKVIGDLKVYYKKKIAELNLKAKTDTVTITVTDTVKAKQGQVLETISGFLNWWEESLVILVAVLLLAWKAKRKLPI